ncbi:hypothetical protein STRDD11_00533 [Streptococcus sp. DD11]|uniref:SP0191 family lipoprotein n=1 Tax=Streptococcus sp. DD11 TaxID=1777879 RepID=UPI00079C42BF|nr:SP0191 family lipoprotein [Streptococcus sp. DD11]KXT85126.1 hypothetical protein STRDD11_00533 [Streptococcus sp. DD11]
MKKILLLLGLTAAVLSGCAQKKTETAASQGKKEEISNNLPIINQAEQQEVITRTVAFPKDEQGAQQTQTVTYQGSHFQRLVIERVTATDPELKEAIKELGIEEAQKSLNESLDKDTDYAQAKTLAGFTGSVTVLNENELKITSTCDFQSLDINKAADMPYFKNLNLKEMVKLTPEEYITNLLANGAEEQK